MDSHIFIVITCQLSIIYKPDSIFEHRSISICYHAIRKAVVMGEILTAYVRCYGNVTAIVIKVFYTGKERDYLVFQVLYDLAD